MPGVRARSSDASYIVSAGRSQQEMLRSARLIAHARGYPALTEVKTPAGGASASLEELQQTTVPSVFTPHAALTPTLADE